MSAYLTILPAERCPGCGMPLGTTLPGPDCAGPPEGARAYIGLCTYCGEPAIIGEDGAPRRLTRDERWSLYNDPQRVFQLRALYCAGLRYRQRMNN